jgi:aminoglycoside phosphotransferase (APT) family kinase protein
MEQSGAWLRRFHELTAAPEQDLSAWVKFQTGEADWRMHKLVVIDPANAPLYTACARKFETEIRQFKNAKSVCMTHGDYAPHNIFVTPDGRLQVLDFYAARNGHPFADIVNYVAKITGFAESIGFSNAKAGAFVRSFLLGYGDLEQSDFPVLRLLLVLQVLKRMAVIRSRRRSALGIVTTDYYRKRYLPYLQRFMSDELPSLTNPWPWPNLPPITR